MTMPRVTPSIAEVITGIWSLTEMTTVLAFSSGNPEAGADRRDQQQQPQAPAARIARQRGARATSGRSRGGAHPTLETRPSSTRSIAAARGARSSARWVVMITIASPARSRISSPSLPAVSRSSSAVGSSSASRRGLPEHRLGEDQPPPHAARKGRDAVVDVGVEADPVGDRAELAVGGGEIEPLQRGDVHRELARGEVLGQVDRLRRIAERAAQRPRGRREAARRPRRSVPALGFSAVATSRSRVDLPAPLGPVSKVRPGRNRA